jgi:hypothetical protein
MNSLARRLHPVVLALLLGLMGAVSTLARAQDVRGFAGRTSLIMVDAPDCAYCRKWDREVSTAYAKSAEGRAAPLSRIRRGDPRLAGIGGLAYTPTFILIVNGREAGRIVGYAGPDFFWGQLDAIVQRNGLVL